MGAWGARLYENDTALDIKTDLLICEKGKLSSKSQMS